MFGATLLLGSAVALPTVAADYPDRPIRVIVPSAPGGAPDVTTRIVVAELTRQMGQQCVVDKRPGGRGIIGAELTNGARDPGRLHDWPGQSHHAGEQSYFHAEITLRSRPRSSTAIHLLFELQPARGYAIVARQIGARAD